MNAQWPPDLSEAIAKQEADIAAGRLFRHPSGLFVSPTKWWENEAADEDGAA